MTLEDKFNQAVKDWKIHCGRNSFSSFPGPYLDCQAYRDIITMGPTVLPLIREEYARPQSIGDPGIYWTNLINEIVPEFNLSPDNENSGVTATPGFIELNIDNIQLATIKWLDENMYQYILDKKK